MKNVGSFPDHSWDRFLIDFGAILAPKTSPKIVQKSSETDFWETWAENLSLDGRGVAIRTVLGASGTDFGRFSDDFLTVLGRFWDAF